MTTVYSNTDKPYVKWEPAYEIVVVWDGSVPRFHWVPFETYRIAKPIAENLSKDYYKAQRFNLARINVARLRPDILEAAAVLLQSKGFSAEVQLNKFEVNHCHTMIIRKR